jgi:hypothetical protein
MMEKETVYLLLIADNISRGTLCLEEMGTRAAH